MWRYVDCRICNSKDYKVIFVDPLAWEGKRYYFKIVKCSVCSQIYTNPLSDSGIGRTYHNANPKEDLKGEYLRRIRIFHYALEEIIEIIRNKNVKGKKESWI